MSIPNLIPKYVVIKISNQLTNMRGIQNKDDSQVKLSSYAFFTRTCIRT